MIELNNISFHYPNSNEILSNISLKINRGSCVAIVGPSGCGKTTLLNLIAGILKPNKGCITVETKNFAYLMQNVTLLPYKTVLENVLLAFTLRNKHTDKRIINKTSKLLQLFRIGTESFPKLPHELSGGMKQKIGLAQTLLTSPNLLLMDEPFIGIDLRSLTHIESYVWGDIRKNKRTMVFITHNIDQALMLSDRIIILNNNSITSEVCPSESFIKLNPINRLKKEEFKRLFYEIIETM